VFSFKKRFEYIHSAMRFSILSVKMKLILYIAVSLISVTNAVTKSVHQPELELTNHYELFENITEQLSELRNEFDQMRGQLTHVETGNECPKYWIPGNESCYLMPLYWHQGWPDAQMTCERIGGHLAVIDTDDELEHVTHLLANVTSLGVGGEVSVWLGGYKFDDFNVMMWVSGQEVDATRYSYTDTVLKRGNNCLLVKDGVVSTHPCKRSNHFLCESNKING